MSGCFFLKHGVYYRTTSVCQVNDFVLPLPDIVRDLGVMMDFNLMFNKHVSAIAHTRVNIII